MKNDFIKQHLRALELNKRLNELDTEIGLLWVQFGELLFQIKRGKEYKKPHPEFKQQNGYKSFADYVGTEFSICRQYAYTLIYGYVKYQTLRDKKLINAGEKLSEGLLRALPNKKDQMISIWQTARKKAGTDKVTPKLIMECRGVKPKKVNNVVDPEKIKNLIQKKFDKLSEKDVIDIVKFFSSKYIKRKTFKERLMGLFN